jgi:2-polyprenyl-3-methyl-5-hydroxy-6-metoxy-1,4-benzoquinol methylase
MNNHSQSTADIVSGNVYDKYGSKNPIVKKMMKGFFGAFISLVKELPVTRILEVGCGEGEVGMRLKEIFPRARYTGTDIAPEVITEARRRYPSLTFEVASISALSGKNYDVDLVIASEVFEHLDNPGQSMADLLRIPFRYLLVSVPREPVWRVLNVARGKYLGDLGNTPGHLNHWSKKGFIEFIKQFDSSLVVVSVLNPFPWTMVLCRKK